MPEFEVSFTRTLELIGRFQVKAKDENEANVKAEQFISELMNETHVGWNVAANGKAHKDVEWEEESDDFSGDMEVSEV